MENDKVCYLVYLITDDNYRENKFIIYDKIKAEMFCNRFNNIIKNNLERIELYYDDDNFDKPTPLWYDKISYYNLIANYEEIKIR